MIVVVTEKPSVARDIASFLRARAKEDGYWEGQGYQVTWSYGHLVTLQEPDYYDSAWRKWSLETLPIVPPAFELRVIPERRLQSQFRIVQRLLQGAERIVAATDAGREGELIFRYILEAAGLQNRSFERLWLSSLTPQAIRQAFASLKPGRQYDDLYHAARCRSEADWLVGMNATRYLTVRYGRRGLLWSAGRVQTPLLALIVERDDEIRTFRPEAFWELITRYRDTRFVCGEGRFARQTDAQQRLQQVEGHPLRIEKVTAREFQDQPPQLYDLTSLQRDMNRRFGMSAAVTLSHVQTLYERKLVTYPRTDSRYLTTDMKPQVPGILDRLRSEKPSEIGQLDLAQLRFSGRIINNAKVTDHHAIIPTGQVPGSLTGPLRKVFDAILTRLIAVFYPPCRKERTVVDAICQGVPFQAKGVRILDPGWTVLYPRSNSKKSNRAADNADQGKSGPSRRGDGDEAEQESELPAFRIGEQGPHQPEVRQGETSPPKRFTENSLLGAMETAGKLVDDEQLKEALKERGLGTPATRAAMIETLLKRNYIRREAKALVATDLGRYLVALITNPQLKSAELTGQWEGELKQIERGQLVARNFMDRIKEYTERLIDADADVRVDKQRWGDCPKCGRPIMEGKKGGFGCTGWKQGCRFVLWPKQDTLELTRDQVRQLLQLGRLVSPQVDEQGEQHLVVLARSGVCVRVPVPDERATTSSSKGRGGRSKYGKGRSSGRSTKNSSTRSRTRRGKGRGKADAEGTEGTAAEEPDASAGARKKSSKPETVGSCPVCSADVIEQPKSFSCARWRDGCAFTVWKTIAGKRISSRTVRTLLAKGKTARLKGFRSRAGKKFDAALRLEGDKVELDFGGDESA